MTRIKPGPRWTKKIGESDCRRGFPAAAKSKRNAFEASSTNSPNASERKSVRPKEILDQPEPRCDCGPARHVPLHTEGSGAKSARRSRWLWRFRTCFSVL